MTHRRSCAGGRRWPVQLLVLLVLGCGETPPEPSAGASVRDSAGVAIQTFPRVPEPSEPLRLAGEPAVRIGVVEGAPEYQWTRPVAGARLEGGGFAVLEQIPPEIRLFDRSGRFVGRVGTEGDGPGELRSPVGLTALPGDTLLVWDRATRRLSWFSTDGTLERERTLREPGGVLRIRRVTLSPGGAVVVLGTRTTEEELANRGRVRERLLVVPVALSGDSAAPVGTVPGAERVIQIDFTEAGQAASVNVQGRWWWGEGFAWAAERGVWTADRLVPELRHFDLESGLDRIVRLEIEERPFTPALIDSLHRVELERVADPELRELWRADFEGRRYPETVPPVAGVFADAAGRVWLGLLDPPPERLPSGGLPVVRRWVVFEEEGGEGARDRSPLRPRGTLTLPRRSHPLWADADGVLLVRNEADLDVAYVEWHPFAGG